MIERSKEILAELEQERLDTDGRAKIARHPTPPEKKTHYQLTLFGGDHPIIDDIRALDLNATTPMHAMQLIQQWKEKLAREKK
jgi:DNA mismatch repair protein MutS